MYVSTCEARIHECAECISRPPASNIEDLARLRRLPRAPRHPHDIQLLTSLQLASLPSSPTSICCPATAVDGPGDAVRESLQPAYSHPTHVQASIRPGMHLMG